MKLLVPGAMAIVLSPDRRQILLHLRSDNQLWSVPGGSAEFGEDIAELTKREVREETGIEVEIIRAFGIYSSPKKFTFHYPDGNEIHSYVIGVECRKIGGFEGSQADDSLDVRWFATDRLPGNLMPMQTEVISDALNNCEFVLK